MLRLQVASPPPRAPSSLAGQWTGLRRGSHTAPTLVPWLTPGAPAQLIQAHCWEWTLITPMGPHSHWH